MEIRRLRASMLRGQAPQPMRKPQDITRFAFWPAPPSRTYWISRENRMAPIFDLILARRISVRVYGFGAVVLGITGLVWGDFAVVFQPAPNGFAGPRPLGYVVAVLPLLAGLAVQWERAAFFGASVLFASYCVAIMFFDVPRGFAHPSVFGAWYGVLENLALAAGALIICTFYPRLEPATAERLSRIARIIFGICLIYFGLAHHFYLANTVSMVPAWLPPGQTFWAYATGAGHVAAGIAIISGIHARLGAVLLTAMFILFTILVHAPRVLSDPHNHFAWGENAVNFALIGSAWVVAASIPAVRKGKA
jgi:uncharacterized membrane protein YphA (DoxX/SURF4 family)